MAAHLHQQGAGQQILVVPAVAQHHRPGQVAPVLHQLPLEPEGKGQIVLPVGVLRPAAAGAHHQHHLGRVLPVLLGDQLINVPLIVHQRVPVYVQHQPDGRVLLQPALRQLPGAVIGPIISRIIA